MARQEAHAAHRLTVGHGAMASLCTYFQFFPAKTVARFNPECLCVLKGKKKGGGFVYSRPSDLPVSLRDEPTLSRSVLGRRAVSLMEIISPSPR